MKIKNYPSQRWLYGIAVLVIVGGLFASVWIVKSAGLGNYPVMISGAYDEGQHRLNVPGSMTVELNRSGAYGIYYEYSPHAASVTPLAGGMPPEIKCTLTSKSGEEYIVAVPDYVEGNKYWTKNRDRAGVLIMSVTVNHPGSYIFACSYPDGRAEPQLTVALGPNYVWEFFRVVGKMGAWLAGAAAVLCGSFLVGLVAILAAAIKRPGQPLSTS